VYAGRLVPAGIPFAPSLSLSPFGLAQGPESRLGGIEGLSLSPAVAFPGNRRGGDAIRPTEDIP